MMEIVRQATAAGFKAFTYTLVESKDL